MTSVPLGCWPYNLSSLAWFGIVISMLIGSALNDIFSYDFRDIVAYWTIFCLFIFVLDQIILGPLYITVKKI